MPATSGSAIFSRHSLPSRRVTNSARLSSFQWHPGRDQSSMPIRILPGQEMRRDLMSGMIIVGTMSITPSGRGWRCPPEKMKVPAIKGFVPAGPVRIAIGGGLEGVRQDEPVVVRLRTAQRTGRRLAGVAPHLVMHQGTIGHVGLSADGNGGINVDGEIAHQTAAASSAGIVPPTPAHFGDGVNRIERETLPDPLLGIALAPGLQ